MQKIMGSYIVFLCISVAVLSGHPDFCQADTYRYIDERGVIHFTNVPTNQNYTRISLENRQAKAGCRAYDPVISLLCKKYAVDEALVKAVIKAESDFDPMAISKKGAQGLMQLMPETARDLSVRNPFHPAQNLEGGVRYLRKLLDQFQGNLQLALAAYNAGENAVVKYNNSVPPFEETRTYVKRVLEYLKDYQLAQ
jgi:soluble lytic murein transglycosylase-like protein